MSVLSGKARSLNGVYTGGYARFYIHRLYAEYMKGGMLMKSKHHTYGKKIADCNFRNYHFPDNFFRKSKVTASAKTVTL